jgi:hypothetical protein
MKTNVTTERAFSHAALTKPEKIFSWLSGGLQLELAQFKYFEYRRR